MCASAVQEILPGNFAMCLTLWRVGHGTGHARM